MGKAIEFSKMSKELLKILNSIKDETTGELLSSYSNSYIRETFNFVDNCTYLMIAAEKLLVFGNNIKKSNDALKNRVNDLEEENKRLYYQLFMLSGSNEKKKHPCVQVDGETIRALKQMGYTNERIAEKLLISKSTVWRKEKGSK